MVFAYVDAGYTDTECVRFGVGMPPAFTAVTAFLLLVTALAGGEKFHAFMALLFLPEIFLIVAACVSMKGFSYSVFSLHYYQTLPTLDQSTFANVIDRPDIYVYNFKEPYPDWQTQYKYEKVYYTTTVECAVEGDHGCEEEVTVYHYDYTTAYLPYKLDRIRAVFRSARPKCDCVGGDYCMLILFDAVDEVQSCSLKLSFL
jgi:hypothetical protein